MTRVRGSWRLRGVGAAMLAALVLAGPAVAIDESRDDGSESTRSRSGSGEGWEDLDERAKRMRRGAGIRVGSWNVQNLEPPEGAESSQSPAFLGYFQKGLDLHLALESTMGLWRWSQTSEESDGFGGTTREEIQTYVLPVFSAIKLYPVTRPDDRLEPFVGAGVGLALGIEDRQGSSSGLLGIGAGGGTSFATGFGFKTGLGVDWKLSKSFGLSAGGQYQWVRFGQPIDRKFKGWGFDAGLTYRFQYE